MSVNEFNVAKEVPAGFWIRLLANFIDAVLVSFPLAIIAGMISFYVYGIDFILEENTMISHILNFVLFLYTLILPVIWRGYVVGKRICGIRIVRIDGENVTLKNMLLRNVVGGLVYVLTFGVGLIISAFMVSLREDKRSIHDLIAGTQVVKKVR